MVGLLCKHERYMSYEDEVTELACSNLIYPARAVLPLIHPLVPASPFDIVVLLQKDPPTAVYDNQLKSFIVVGSSPCSTSVCL